MADQKLTDMASGAPAEGTDLIYAVKDPAGTPANSKLTLDEVKDYVAANGAAGSTGEIQFNDGGAFGSNPYLVTKSDVSFDVMTFGGTDFSPTSDFLRAGFYRSTGGYTGVFAENATYAGGFPYYGYAELYAVVNTFGGFIYLNGKDNSTSYTGTIQIQMPMASGASYDYTLTLPTSAGSSGQALTTDGSGVLSWTDPAKSSAPASASATGRAGEIRYDSDFVYICVSSNSWKRAALSSW